MAVLQWVLLVCLLAVVFKVAGLVPSVGRPLIDLLLWLLVMILIIWCLLR